MNCLRRALPLLPRLTLVLLPALVGCSVLLDTGEEQCTTEADCTARGKAFANTTCVKNLCVDNTWACLDAPTSAPTADAGSAGGALTVQFNIIDIETNAPAKDTKVKVCPAGNPFSCDAPQQTIDADPATGVAKVTVDSGVQQVYFEVSSTGTMTALSFPPKYLPSGETSLDLRLIPLEVFANYAVGYGASISEMEGELIAFTVDCQSRPAASISIAADVTDPDMREFYIKDGQPSMETGTDDKGLAGYINLPQGTVNITAKLEPQGRTIGSRNAFVRKGAVTFLSVGPNN